MTENAKFKIANEFCHLETTPAVGSTQLKLTKFAISPLMILCSKDLHKMSMKKRSVVIQGSPGHGLEIQSSSTANGRVYIQL